MRNGESTAELTVSGNIDRSESSLRKTHKLLKHVYAFFNIYTYIKKSIYSIVCHLVVSFPGFEDAHMEP